MREIDPIDALRRARVPFGGARRDVVIGRWAIRLAGLDDALADDLDRRWGPFALARVEDDDVEALVRVDLADGGDAAWLPEPAPGERYRVEARVIDGRPVLGSYHFLAGPDVDRAGAWRALVTRSPAEPVGRVVENLVRMLLARAVVEHGGVPFHAAGVLRDDGAHLLVGPSGAGKSTALALSRPCVSLGDDFGFAVPHGDGWVTAAVPFDNREAVRDAPPAGWLALAGVWRLFQAEASRLETPSAMARDLSILACAAAPWSMPDLGDALMAAVARLGREVPYGHVHFRLSGDFWDRIAPS